MLCLPCKARQRLWCVDNMEMDHMAPGIDHRGVVLSIGGARKGGGRLIQTTVDQFLDGLSAEGRALVLVLDEITDPHNLGAILRSADQFAVDLVVVPQRNSAGSTETVTKVSSGAAQYVPMAVETNLNREIKKLKDNGFWVYGADMGPFYMALPAVSAILIGGASVNKASIPNVIIGTLLFQGILTMLVQIFAQFRDPFPMCIWCVSFGTEPRVEGQYLCAPV